MQAKTILRGRATPLDPLPEQPAGLCGCGCLKPVARRYAKGHARVRREPLAVATPGPMDTPCWVWIASKTSAGYGECSYSGNTRGLAHRAIYEEMVGPIPEGLTIDHLCANTLCVNAAHLEPVTLAENTRRQWADGRASPNKRQRDKTHCIRGHEFTEENTYRNRGRRHCRACWKERA